MARQVSQVETRPRRKQQKMGQQNRPVKTRTLKTHLIYSHSNHKLSQTTTGGTKTCTFPREG